MEFTGFSPETVDFLWGIRLNNNRDWFLQNKKAYTDYLYEPMKALGRELFLPFADTPGNQLKVSRIYRDARMHPPEPYKESLWICIRQDVKWWAENPCLYFEITPEGVSYGFFFWKMRTDQMDAFRKNLAANPEPFLKLIHDTQEETSIRITAESYKRPKPCDDPRLQEYMNWKGAISCTVELPFGEEVFTPELAGRVRDLFQKLIPLYTYFQQYGA